jgi:hypothetical protein
MAASGISHAGRRVLHQEAPCQLSGKIQIEANAFTGFRPNGGDSDFCKQVMAKAAAENGDWALAEQSALDGPD